jgi:hypothetical protein
MHRTITTLFRRPGCRSNPFPQTEPNLTLATETLYSALNNQRVRLYDAPDLRQHVLNATSVETSRGFRLAKESNLSKLMARFTSGQTARCAHCELLSSLRRSARVLILYLNNSNAYVGRLRTDDKPRDCRNARKKILEMRLN